MEPLARPSVIIHAAEKNRENERESVMVRKRVIRLEGVKWQGLHPRLTNCLTKRKMENNQHAVLRKTSEKFFYVDIHPLRFFYVHQVTLWQEQFRCSLIDNIHVVMADFLKPSLNFRCNFMSILSCVTSPPVTEMTILGAFSFQYVTRSRQICPGSVSRSSTRIYGFYMKS